MDTIHMQGYENIETLYESRDTIVCRARNKQGEIRILKTIKDNYPSEEQLAQLEYEYSILNQLEGQGIIHVCELIKHYKGHIIVMENIDGIPLLNVPVFESIRNENKKLSTNKLMLILNIFIKMTEVIGKLHDKNLIHKEINPGIFLIKSDFSQVSILDFGLTKKINNSRKEFHNTEGIEVLLPYISPEQTGRMGRLIDYRTDFYSLGVSMYELITGKRPFTTNNMLEMIHSHIAKTPIAPHIVNLDIPKSVSEIIMKLMAKELEQRYQSAQGIIHDLRKCLEALVSSGAVGDFEVGMNDVSNKFQIPQKLYGRDRERGTLKQLYQQVAKGGSHMLLVGGYAGVGKTSIIQEIYRPVAEVGGFFASGKAEQLQINTPYFLFTQVAKELIRMLLQEPDFMLDQWKGRLLKALNDNGQLIIDLVPELESIIGTQPKVEELEPTENRNRFLNTFGNFFKVFAGQTHPLTVFLDDLQWCDLASMKFMEYLLALDDMESFIVVGCYRDNEVMEEHPLYNALNELRKSDKATTFIVKPLEEKSVSNIIMDTVHCHEVKAQSLAKIIHKKTKGNPFFVKNLLLHLYTNGFIRYSEEMHQWEWDDNEIQNIAISDNIVDFMINQILKLPQKTQNLLKVAALVGTTFNLEILADVENMDALEVAAGLKEAVDSEIIIPESDYYDIVSMIRLKDINIDFRFTHDRVQQACIELIQEEAQKQLHLKIGKSIKQNIPINMLKDHAMSIVCHLNEGLEEIKSLEERFETARLNLWACQKAKATSSFKLSLQYVSNGIRVLPDNAWTQDYELTFEIIKIYAECAYLNNEYALAEKQIEILMEHAKTPIDQAEIRLMQSIIYRFLGQFDKVTEYGILGLRLLGIRIPSVPGWHSVIKEMIIVKARLWGKNTETLLNAAPIKNDEIKLIIRIMGELYCISYNAGNINLFLFSILKGLNLTLSYGNSREAASIYCGYAVLLAVLGELQNSFKFNKLALKLVESEERAKYRASVLFAYGFFGHAWSGSWQDLHQWFEKTMEEAIKYGDHYQIGLAGTFMYTFKADTNLKLLIEKAMKQVPLIIKINNKYAYYMSFLFIHRWLNYIGLTDGQFTMNVSRETYELNGSVGVVCSEEECLEYLQQINSLSGIGVYYKEKMYIHYIYDDYTGAMKYLKESDKYLKEHSGTPYLVECRMCNFLVLAANIKEMGAKEAVKVRRRLRREYKYIRSWAKYNPANFQHLQYILEAELERIDGKIYKAAEFYELAIQTAGRNGFIRDEALANELAAKMFLAAGMNKQAAFYMMEAFKGYKVWGADAKTRHIKEKYGHLLNISESDGKVLKTYERVELEDIDLMSIMSAYRAISKEVQLPDLLRQIMKIVVENSGAQKAYILLKYEHGWNIEAEWLQGEDEVKVLHSVPLEEAEGVLAASVINFCIRTGEYVVLADAARQGNFYKDPYILKAQTKSLLCMPITNQGVLIGILYIENNLSRDVFTDNHVEVLQLLTAQFSISIKNVQLFSNLLVTTEELHRSMEESLRSEIAFLQAQIKPHFLYNALNTISAFSLDDPKMTRDLLANLSQYLRGSFDFKNRDKLVHLHKELELVEAYLFIEKARFGKRLQVVYDIDDNIDCMLPPLVIQPLVENSVQHGLAGRKNGGTVRIAVYSKNSFIVISVEDDGVGIPESLYGKLLSDEESKSVALKNINQRLIRLYGHGLEIERRVGGGAKMVIRIPMESKGISSKPDISLENAYLYDNLKELVDERTRELREEINERKKTENLLSEMANYDYLTNLSNRRRLEEVLEESIIAAKQNKNKICVLFVDLDGFKAINDKYGHDKGDVVLVTVAQRISEAVRSCDTVSRMGGDEFVIILQRVTGISKIKEICHEIITSVGKPILLNEEGIEVAVTTSIGVSISPFDGETAEELISNADKAMYIAKKNGKNRFVFYSEEYEL
ncbi:MULTISPECIES: diguanylate cyclase [unclassified Clostridium]|uniref:diguanylate cyclase domain-containing protein n=1 Tax=unclassified Clostridium TaxID=2614128 RepID=UPI00029798B0|nr:MULTISPECIES: diguanylate cyclase [unclassified Clostridium]EKQ53622.1 MAG: diguanylate cyclase (GGDEF) domain-containing protein [Clostridium sp. Maddingley MBC34-26]